MFKNLFKKADDESEREQLAEVERIGMVWLLKGPGIDKIPRGVGEFGRCPENPIPVNGPPGEVKYLTRLVCGCGRQLMGHRVRSISCQLWAAPIDVYETVCAEGKHWDILYFHCYYPRRSTFIPDGYGRLPFHPQFSRTTIGMVDNEFHTDFPFSLATFPQRDFGEVLGGAVVQKIGYRLADKNGFCRPAEHQRKLAALPCWASAESFTERYPSPSTRRRRIG